MFHQIMEVVIIQLVDIHHQEGVVEVIHQVAEADIHLEAEDILQEEVVIHQEVTHREYHHLHPEVAKKNRHLITNQV